jgi:hypothetical protein
MVDLETLVAELHRLAATREWPVTLVAEELSECTELTALPRYGGGTTGLHRLYSDLESAIDSIFEEKDRRIARAHFRLEYGDRQLMERHRALNADGSEETTKTRRKARETIEPRLAFHLFQRGIEWEKPYTQLDWGFRIIEHDWTLTVDPFDLSTETLTQKIVARAARPGQRFYVFSCNNLPAVNDSLRVVSDDPDHVLVGEDGTVPVERSMPNGEFLAVVYLGKDYTTNDEVRTGISRVAKMDVLPRDSGIFLGPLSHPVKKLRLTADVPLAVAPIVTLVDRTSPGWGAQNPTTIHRTDESPVVYEVKPEVGHTYEIVWVYNA